MELNERLQQIKTNWAGIKENDPGCAAPGAMSHHYYLDRENVPRQAIEHFELSYGVKLPEEYREYLIQVSNGGACPFNVMYSLQDALSPLNKGKKGADGYSDWLERNPDHYVSDFPVTEEQIIAWLTYKIKHATVETPPIVLNYHTPGYLFLCTAESGTHYIMPLNGACVNEIWVMKEATRTNDAGETEPCFHFWPEVRFVNDQIKTLSFLEWIEDEQQNWFNKNRALDHRLAAIKIIWFNLAAHDREESVFGAFMHHYHMNPVLTEENVVEFEAQYNFTMPEEYRQYLKLVGNGGVGPFYGMYNFERSLVALNSGNKEDGSFINYLEKNPDHFSKAFPVTDEQVNDYLTKKIANPSAALPPIKLDVNAGGYLFLAEYGCGGYYMMPLNGNGAGEVWFLQKMDANKLTFELRDNAGNLIESGSYGDDGDDSYFELYPQLKWNKAQASTLNFLEWLEYRQNRWFAGNEEEEAVEDIDNENAYYPLAVGNKWIFDSAGQHLITTIESSSTPGEFVLSNSLSPVKGQMKKVKGDYFTDDMEKGNMQLILKDNLRLGDSWEAHFKASTLDCVYVYTAKEMFETKTIEGKEYKQVVEVAMESYYIMNGTRMPMNAFSHTYYAKGVGPVLTTTSGVIGDSSSPLLSYELH